MDTAIDGDAHLPWSRRFEPHALENVGEELEIVPRVEVEAQLLEEPGRESCSRQICRSDAAVGVHVPKNAVETPVARALGVWLAEEGAVTRQKIGWLRRGAAEPVRDGGA